MSFTIKDDDVFDKYNEIWNKIKEKLNIKFHSMPVCDEKYMKAKVREFNGVIKTNSLGNEKKRKCTKRKRKLYLHSMYNFWLLWEWKKNYPQVYLEECKYKIKKTKMTKFINTELESELESETKIGSKSELESETE